MVHNGPAVGVDRRLLAGFDARVEYPDAVVLQHETVMRRSGDKGIQFWGPVWRMDRAGSGMGRLGSECLVVRDDARGVEARKR